VALKPVKPPKQVKVLEAKSLKKQEKKTKPVVTAAPAKQEIVVKEAETVVEEVILTNADGFRYCKISECDELSTSDGYCRYHYLLNWKKIQLRKRILAGDKLDRYIEELTAKYPDKYLEMIRRDLVSEKDFLAAIQELEIDDSGDDSEFEDDAKNYIDEVRGVTTTGEDEDF